MLTTFELINTDMDINKKRITKYRTNLDTALLGKYPIAEIERKIMNEVSMTLYNRKQDTSYTETNNFHIVTDMKNNELLIIIYDYLYQIPISFDAEIDFD